MAVIMIMRWEGVSLDDYEKVRSIDRWDDVMPSGGMFHVATHDGTALRVVDLWESAEAFQDFATNRLGPATAKAGISGQPEVEIYPVHITFTGAAYQRIIPA